MSFMSLVAKYLATPPTPSDLQEVPLTVDSTGALRVSSSGGGGGAVTIADGADVALGARADAAYVSGSGTVIALLKGMFGQLGSLVTGVVLAAGAAVIGAVTQSGVWNITNISGTVSLPTGASTAANQTSPMTPVAAAAASATQGWLAGMQFLTTLPTPTNAQQMALNADARGGLIVGGHVASDATDLGNPVKVGGVYNSTLPVATSGRRYDVQIGSRGALRVELLTSGGVTASVISPASDAFANSNGLLVNTQTLVFNGTTWDRLVKLNAVSRIVSAAASTNATSAKVSAGNLGLVSFKNNAAYDIFLKFYNKASAPTVGTDTPVLTQCLPANSAGFLDLPQYYYFSTGIAYALTKLVADNDTTVLVAADVTALNVVYA